MRRFIKMKKTEFLFGQNHGGGPGSGKGAGVIISVPTAECMTSVAGLRGGGRPWTEKIDCKNGRMRRCF